MQLFLIWEELSFPAQCLLLEVRYLINEPLKVYFLEKARSMNLSPDLVIKAIGYDKDTNAWAKMERGEITMEEFTKQFNERLSELVILHYLS